MERKLNPLSEQRLTLYELPIGDNGIVLETGCSYIFPLLEELNLPTGVYGRANPKSTTGRLDVFARLVTEYATSFDNVPAGYRGRLYLELVPQSFAIRIRRGDSLAQVRFQVGDPFLSDEATRRIVDNFDLIMGPDGVPLRSHNLNITNGIVLSVSLPRRHGSTVGYRACHSTQPIDLQAIGQARRRHYWDRIYGDSKLIILEPGEFYIFASRELIRLPSQYCAEMVAFDPGNGEVRTHYAGFFDSGFGYHPDKSPDQTAAAVVLEVRSRDIPFLLEDGQELFRIRLMHSTEEPERLYGQGIGSSYQSQRLQLPKQFARGGENQEDDGEHPQPHLEL